MPQFIPCQLASQARALPVGEEWIYEPKFDGFRLQMCISGGVFRLFTRGGHDWTERLGRSLPGNVFKTHSWVLDGEICALDEDGRPDFGLLGRALSDKSVPLSYFAFDLLACSGTNLTSLPLLSRKERLAEVVAHLGIDSVKFVAHSTDGNTLAETLKHERWEGVMAKHRDAPYRPATRSPAWRKFKFTRRQEFVVAGWSPDKLTGAVKSIVVATMDNGALTLRGSVGSGFSVSDRTRLAEIFAENAAPRNPSHRTNGGIRFLQPSIVAEIEYLELSSNGCVRGASYIGLREDKTATDAHLETFAANPHEDGSLTPPRLNQ